MVKKIRIDLDTNLSVMFNDVVTEMKALMNTYHISKKEALRFLIDNYHINKQKFKKKNKTKNEYTFI